jgi:hypothetical protein
MCFEKDYIDGQKLKLLPKKQLSLFFDSRRTG